MMASQIPLVKRFGRPDGGTMWRRYHYSPKNDIPGRLLSSQSKLSQACTALPSRLPSAYFTPSGRMVDDYTSDSGYAALKSTAAAIMVGITAASMSAGGLSTNNENPCSTSFASMESKNASPEAIATSYAPLPLKELGHALAEMHEKQQVRLGRILHDLNEMAQESLVGKSTEPPTLENEELSDHGELIKIPEDLEHIYPHEAWRIIQDLQQMKHSQDDAPAAKISRSDIKRIFSTAAQVLRKDPTLVDLRNRQELETVSVVGDLHGHFESLLDVFELVGMEDYDGSGDNALGTPWKGTGAIIFNGDFIDRGDDSLGVFLSLLLLKIAFPNYFYLNRGNHEDDLIATVYGFTEELESLYGTKQRTSVDDIWQGIGDVFAALPICVCTKSAVIMHGGIPSKLFKLDDLRAISATERSQIRSVLEPNGCKIKEMFQNVLWSDPRPENGVFPNEDRGAGVTFGPDVTRNFLVREGFVYLVRSHEPVDMGYEPIQSDGESTGAVTVFSAAKYPCGEGANWGAIIRLHRDGNYEPVFFPGRVQKSQKTSVEVLAELSQLIASKCTSLNSAFRSISKSGSSIITVSNWADVMKRELNLANVDWVALRPYIVSTVSEGTESDEESSLIDFEHFLNLHCNLTYQLGETSMSGLKQQQNELLRVFNFLDADRSGFIDRDEFRVGIELLNKRADSKILEDPDKLFDTIDTSNDGLLDIDEFKSAFEEMSTPFHIACFKQFDTDHSGSIYRDEFLGALKALNENLPQHLKFDLEQANIIFDRLDADGSGELDVNEFQDILKDVGYLPN